MNILRRARVSAIFRDASFSIITLNIVSRNKDHFQLFEKYLIFKNHTVFNILTFQFHYSYF